MSIISTLSSTTTIRCDYCEEMHRRGLMDSTAVHQAIAEMQGPGFVFLAVCREHTARLMAALRAAIALGAPVGGAPSASHSLLPMVRPLQTSTATRCDYCHLQYLRRLIDADAIQPAVADIHGPEFSFADVCGTHAQYMSDHLRAAIDQRFTAQPWGHYVAPLTPTTA